MQKKISLQCANQQEPINGDQVIHSKEILEDYEQKQLSNQDQNSSEEEQMPVDLIKITNMCIVEKQQLMKHCNIIVFEEHETKKINGSIFLHHHEIIIQKNSVDEHQHGQQYSRFSLKNLHKMRIFLIHNKKDQIISLSEKQNFEISCKSEVGSISTSLNYILFASILQLKLNQMEIQYSELMYVQMTESIKKKIKKAKIYGYLYKKSKYLGLWHKRFAVINQNGFFSYTSQNQQVHNFEIRPRQINSITTDLHFHEDYLIIKVKKQHQQTQIAIPFVNFLTKRNNWLYRMHQILVGYKQKTQSA